MLLSMSYSFSDSPDSWWTANGDGVAPGWATMCRDDGAYAYDATTWDVPGGRDPYHGHDVHVVDRCWAIDGGCAYTDVPDCCRARAGVTSALVRR